MALILLIVASYSAVPAHGQTPNTSSDGSLSNPVLVAADAYEQESTRETSSATADKPRIISREEWKAKEPVGTMTRHKPSRITIHHTASLQHEKIPIDQKMRNLQRFSQGSEKLSTGKLKPVWPDIPYHYYVASDGQIAEGRKVEFVGDTNTEYDPSGHILVVLEGNFEKEQPTAKQLKSLYELVSWLAGDWKIPARDVKGHNDYARTACPGKNMAAEIVRLREAVASRVSTANN